jgi:hypothetical protein
MKSEQYCGVDVEQWQTDLLCKRQKTQGCCEAMLLKSIIVEGIWRGNLRETERRGRKTGERALAYRIVLA